MRSIFQMDNTLNKCLTHPKDQIKKEIRTDRVYEIHCHDRNATYIGETSRQLQTCLTEHQIHIKHPPKNEVQLQNLEKDSAIALHALTTDHNIYFDEKNIIAKHLNSHAERCCAETLALQTSATCVNRNDGKPISSTWLALLDYIKVQYLIK